MAQIVKLRRTATTGKIPTTSNLELGELAMNTNDGRIFFKKNDGSDTIEEILTTNPNLSTTGSININGSITASAGIQVAANIMPNADNTLSLGSSTLRFQLNGGTPVTVSGTGTANTLTRFQSATTVEDSNIVSSDTATTFTHSNNGNTIFTVSGSNGELLTITDSNTGNLLEVNDASGIDVFTVSAVGDVSASGAITASGFNVINDVSVTGNISGSSFNGTGLVSGSGGLSYATSTTRGVVELFSNTTQTVASNTVSTTANRTYGIQLNSANQAVVNVPWSNTTFSASDLNGTGVISGSQQLNGFVSASGNFVSNELIVADGTNSVTSSNLLSVDSTNNRVGIGTSSPATKLHIAGDGANEGQVRLQQANNGGDGPDFAFYASRGTIASPSSVQDNDVQGRINAYAYNGSSFVQGGSFGWSSDGTNGDNDFTLSTRVDNSLGVKLGITNTGAIRFNEAYTFPISDGTANQVLQTDGSGAITFGTINEYTNANNTTHLNSLAVVSGSASQVLSFINVESNADVTDSTNVVSSLVSATSISSGNKGTIQSNLGVDSAGTDNSTDVTLTGTPDYITISGQVITRNQIDLANDVTGILPSANLDSDTAHLSGTQTFSGAKTFSATGNSIIIGDTLRIDENGSGLRMTNVGAFDNSSGNFRIFSNSDLILSTNGDSGTAVTFDSTTKDATFTGDINAVNLTLSGDLTVSGTTTTVNSTTVNIGDSILELNYGGTATEGGILIKDGTGASTTSGSILWDATNDYWKAGKLGSEQEILLKNTHGVVSGSDQLSGFISASGNFVANETIIATGTNSVTSSNILALDTTNNYLGINQSNPEVTLHMTGEGAQSAQIRMEQHNDTSDAPDIRTRKSRGTSASPTKNNAGDYIYRQNSERHNGTGYVTVGQFAVDTNSSNADRFQLTLAVSEDGGAVDASTGVQFKIDGNDNGAITFNGAYKFPTSDGSANQVLQTNGSGTLTFATPAAGYADSDVTSHINSLAVVSGSNTEVRTFLNVEDGADVTDSTNVVSSLVSATSISSGNKGTIQSNLGVDSAGTKNSTDVSLAGSYDYITAGGTDNQTLTLGQVDASTDISNLTTSNVSEGTNQYFTNARVKTKLTAEDVVSGSKSDVLTFLNVEDGATADQSQSDIQTLLGTGNNALVPTAGTAGQFLKHDGTFGTPSYTTNTNTNQLTTFTVRDDDNDDFTISQGKFIKFVSTTGTAGTNITGTGTTSDPYLVTITSPDTTTNTMGTGFTVSATTDTTATTITQGDDLFFAAGTGIGVETTADGTVTITNTSTNVNTNQLTTFIVRDDDDDEKEIAQDKFIKFTSAVGAAGTNLSGTGTTGDPFVLAITSPNDNDNTQNAYSVSIPSSTTKLRLSGTGADGNTTDDIEFVGSGATTVTRTNENKFTISSTDNNDNTQNTTTLSFVDSSNDIILRNTTGGAGSGNQDININAGSNITLTHTDANNIEISSTDTDTVYTHPNHTGDVTSVADGATTIGANKVTHAKYQQVATDTIIGRTTAGTGNVTALTASEVRGIIGTGNGKLVPSAGSSGEFLKHDGTFGTPSYTSNSFRTITAGGNTLGGSETLAFTAGTNITITESGGAVTITSTDTNDNTQLSDSEVQAIVGAMFSGNTETRISATYQSGDGTIDLVVNDMTANDDVSIANLKTRLAGGFGSNAVQIGDSTDTITIPGNLTVQGTQTINDVNLINTSNGVIFEGTTDDGFETTLTATDPTADRAITLPNKNGTVAMTSDITGTNSGTNTGDETLSSINALDITEVGTISSGVWQGSAISTTYIANTSGTNTGDETLSSINALDITEVGTITSGVWNGSAISTTYLSGQSGTNTGDETKARINALDITEVGTISSGVWQGTPIADAYLSSNTAHLSGTQTFTGEKIFSNILTVSNTTATNATDTGALVVTGGVGIGGGLNVGGDVVAYASSDERYKDNVTRIENPNEKLKQIGGYTFDWNDNHEIFKGQHDVGVIAQEIEKVLPEIVETRESGYKAVKYEKIVALLIESNKELLSRVEELESKLK